MINVRYFGSLTEQLGQADGVVTADKVDTIADVWHEVSGGAPIRPNLLMALNMEYAHAETPVHDGDEVAFFPPVTGG
jgi:molybdopterin synthase sulfur carrier subunit